MENEKKEQQQKEQQQEEQQQEEQQEKIELLREWLTLEKYSFKIMVAVAVLADENRAFRGKISELCNELGIQPKGANPPKIKECLKMLEEEGYVKLIVDKDTYTVSFARTMEKNKDIIRLKKIYYQLIREKGGKDAWGNMLKVFLELLELSEDDIVTYKQIGEKIGVGEKTVERCVKKICGMDFDGLFFSKQRVTENVDGQYFCKGQTYGKRLSFSSMSEI